MSAGHRRFDVVVIGAGPAGALAAALLRQRKLRVLVLEKQHFPRFSIGESLLPQCMIYLEQGDMLGAVQAAGFQYKDGAAFSSGGAYASFDFEQKTSPGPSTTFQVERAPFDQILADACAAQGAEVRYGHEIVAFRSDSDQVSLDVLAGDEPVYTVEARFALDASGFGRVLARLLKLESPSEFPPRSSTFTHVEDRIDDTQFDRDKILISVHPERTGIWYWLIPFANGRASIGVVTPAAGDNDSSEDAGARLQNLVGEAGYMAALLRQAKYDTAVRSITGYACNVSRLYGDGYALLGNAAEFLDPVFSSGVTIALKSASLAADVVERELAGAKPDWEAEYARSLRLGVNTFRRFVGAWYDGRMQDIIFATEQNPEVRRMICSILAGYAWDTDNPYVREPERLDTLAELCRA